MLVKNVGYFFLLEVVVEIIKVRVLRTLSVVYDWR